MTDILISIALILGYVVGALLTLGTLLAIGVGIAYAVYCRREDHREDHRRAEQRRTDDAFNAIVAQFHQKV